MSEERRAVILRRVRAGETMTAVAQDIGVSRQYVSAVVKRAREGKRTAGRRGRPKDQPLTSEEADALYRHLVSRPQRQRESSAIIAWFRTTFDRPFSVHQLRRFCTDRGLPLRAPVDEAERSAEAPSAVPSRRRGRPRKDQAPVEPSRMTADELAAMERSNADVAARLADHRRPPRPAQKPAGQLRRNDPCPLDPSRKFKKCCGRDGSKICHKQDPAGDGPLPR